MYRERPRKARRHTQAEPKIASLGNHRGSSPVRRPRPTSGDVVSGVAVDEHENVYTSGSFGTSNFTSVFVADSLTAESAGGLDGFLVKHSPSGDVLWLRTLGTSSDDSAQDVTMDEMGNVYVAGPRLFSFPLGCVPWTQGCQFEKSVQTLPATKWLPKWLGCEPRLIVVSLDS